ncbi:MAG: tetratricopeptide repeat protein [Candidatus Heimdallarchaeota archaeon]|nr:tetratricopeptide repeat protein [Candidatus Heimdallarchaeota archaeon]
MSLKEQLTNSLQLDEKLAQEILEIIDTIITIEKEPVPQMKRMVEGRSLATLEPMKSETKPIEQIQEVFYETITADFFETTPEEQQDEELWRMIQHYSEKRAIEAATMIRIRDYGVLSREAEEELFPFLVKKASILVEGKAGVGKTFLVIRLIKRWLHYWTEKGEETIVVIPKSSSLLEGGEKEGKLAEEQKGWGEKEREMVLREVKKGKKVLIVADDLEVRSEVLQSFKEIRPHVSLLATKRIGKKIPEIKNLKQQFPPMLEVDFKTEKDTPKENRKFSYSLEPDKELEEKLFKQMLEKAENYLSSNQINLLKNNYQRISEDFTLGIPVFVIFLFMVIREKGKNRPEEELPKILENIHQNIQETTGKDIYNLWLEEVIRNMPEKVKLFIKTCIELRTIFNSPSQHKITIEMAAECLKEQPTKLNMDKIHPEICIELEIANYNEKFQKYRLQPPHLYDFNRNGMHPCRKKTTLAIYQKLNQTIKEKDNLLHPIDRIAILIDIFRLKEACKGVRYAQATKLPLKEALKIINELEFEFVLNEISLWRMAIRGLITNKIQQDKILAKTIAKQKMSKAEDIPEKKMKEEKKALNDSYKTIIHWIKEHLKEDENFYEAWFEIGLLEVELGNSTEGIKAWEKVVAINEDYHEAWTTLGVAYAQKGEVDRAIECWEKALAINEDDHEAWYNLGLAYYQKGELDRAIECYQKAVAINEDFHQAWTNMGIIYSEKGDFNKANKIFSKLIQEDEDNASHWYNLACICALQNDKTKALEYLEKAIELDPKFREMAETDSDFDAIRKSKEFRTLIHQE